jgi:chorismate mutase/prephenate dehydratase
MKYEEEVAVYRNEINRLNEEILEKIRERTIIALKVGEIKQRYGKPVVDKARERAVLNQVRASAEAKGLNPDAIEKIFAEVIQACVEAEESQK